MSIFLPKTYGAGIVEVAFNFLGNGASNPVLTGYGGDGYSASAAAPVTRDSQGNYTARFQESFFELIYMGQPTVVMATPAVRTAVITTTWNSTTKTLSWRNLDSAAAAQDYVAADRVFLYFRFRRGKVRS